MHFGCDARRMNAIFQSVVLPHFGFRAQSTCFWLRSGVLLMFQTHKYLKFFARAFGAREPEFILAVTRVEKAQFFSL